MDSPAILLSPANGLLRYAVTGQRRRAGVDESASCIGHRDPCHIDRGLEALIFFPPLALFATVFFVSKLDPHRLDVLAGGLSVLLDHGIDRIGERGLGDARRHRSGVQKDAGTSDARAGCNWQESSPRRVDGRAHHGVVDCRRVCGCPHSPKLPKAERDLPEWRWLA